MLGPITVNQTLRKGLVFSLMLICVAFNSLAQPTINAFSPASGPVGTAVTISGSNFSTVTSDNIVFVGGVKANVTAATSNSLTVTVPAGALYQPISVTTNGLTAYAKNPFLVIFTGAAAGFTARSFGYAGRVDSVASGIETTGQAVGDFDDDKRMDIVTIDRLNNTMSVYRNTTTGGVVSFAPKMNFPGSNEPRGVAVADIDGDGKPDVVVTNRNGNFVSIYKNTSVSGTISFASMTSFSTAPYPAGISVADLDNDGKPDLVTHSISFESTVSILRNTSSGGTISFETRVDLKTLAGISEDVKTADMDGDGKTDILVPDYALGQVQIYKNTSSTGSLSFAAKKGVGTNANPWLLEVGDLNSDGRPDLLVSYYWGNNASILTNTSSSGTVSFSTIIHLPFGDYTYGKSINDLDGDGRPDVMVGAGSNGIALFKNTSVAGGAITFNADIKLPTPYNDILTTADFDNDGKTDIAAESGIFRVTVWKNKTTGPQALSFSPGKAGTGTSVTISGVNFTGVNAVSFGGVPAASFTVVNDNTVTAVVGAGASGQVTVKTAQDSCSVDGFIFTAPPVITGFTPTTAGEGDTVTITGNYFMDVTGVSFGGTAAVSFSVKDEHTIMAKVGYGKSGQISVTTQYGTGSAPGFSHIPRPVIASFTPTAMGDGTKVSIYGYNLSGVTAVSFGGVPARSFTIISDNQIDAIVEVAASGSTVMVTNPYGTATKEGIIFIPPPTITSFSPTRAKTGDMITITGTNLFWYVTNVKFGGVPAAGLGSQGSTTLTAYVGEGASGDVTVLSTYGNASMPGFTYIPRPVITSFSPATAPIGATITITGEHLASTQKVSIGNVQVASFNVVSDNMITVVTGVGTDGPITVTAEGGAGISSGSFLFQYPKPEIISFTPTSNRGGADITIKGRNFLPGLTSVSFGNTPAYYAQVISDTSIYAMVGAGSSGDVKVKTPGGEASMPGFTYINPPPAIYGVTPMRALEGTVVAITGERFSRVTAVTFGGVPAASFTIQSDTYITAIVGKGASGDVEVSTFDGKATKTGFVFGETTITSISPATGGPGTVVTITGTGFTDVSYINFGNAYANTRTVNSPTSITVTVPQDGAGLVTIYFSDWSIVSSDKFTYQSPVTTIGSVSPSVGGVGSTVSITGAGFSQATAVTFGGVPVASYTVNSPYSITATLAGGASGNVEVTSPTGTGVFNGFSYTTAPVITGLSQEAALSGENITITGVNFKSLVAANTVYFGGVKAAVVAASDKSLTVKVPVGAPYDYISVTCNNLTGYSQKKFKTLFTATAPLSANSFDARIDSAWGTRQWHVTAADFDLDGKSDVAVCHSGTSIHTGHIALFKNNSNAGKLSFLPKDLITADNMPLNSVTGDLDGDGKLDLMVANAMDGQNLSVYRNASTGNKIAFDNEILLSLTGPSGNVVACTDFDADGKPDIFIAAQDGNGKAYVYRNTSTVGNLSFVKVLVTVPDFVTGIKVADMDLDGRPDLIMSAQPLFIYTRGVICRNVSAPGNISFEPAQYFQTGADSRELALVDIDGDGKMDIVSSGSYYSNSISIVRNLSLPGKISMSSKTDFMTIGKVKSVGIGDMNGDGKPDILASLGNVNKLIIYPNNSTPANLSFGQNIELNTIAPVNSICVSDLDADLRPDIIVSNEDAGSISFFRSKLSAQLLTSFSPSRGPTGTVVTIRGENLANATAVTFGGVPVTAFTVVDANTITAVVGAGNSGDVSVTTPLGTVKQSGFVYVGPPVITSFTPTTAGTSSTVTIKGADFMGATAVSFGGVPARSFNVTSDTTITAVVDLGASGKVVVTTPLGTGTRDGFIYDALTAIVDPGNVNSTELTVQPNPARDVLVIKHPASVKTATLRFVDITGRTVKTIIPAQQATQTVTSVNGLQAGIYAIVWSEGVRTLSRVITVQ